MKKTIAASLVFLLASAADAQQGNTFNRPDCSAFQGTSHEPESRCFRKNKIAVRYENYEALQKTGLEFIHLERAPSGDELKAYPDAKKAVDDKVEGEFLVTFSVNTDGNVYDVKIIEATSEPIRHLAKLWAGAIAQWKFVKTAKPVTDVPFRRLYLYSREDEGKSGRKSNG